MLDLGFLPSLVLPSRSSHPPLHRGLLCLCGSICHQQDLSCLGCAAHWGSGGPVCHPSNRCAWHSVCCWGEHPWGLNSQSLFPLVSPIWCHQTYIMWISSLWIPVGRECTLLLTVMSVLSQTWWGAVCWHHVPKLISHHSRGVDEGFHSNPR